MSFSEPNKALTTGIPTKPTLPKTYIRCWIFFSASVVFVKRESTPAVAIKNIKMPADTANSMGRESSVRTAALPSTLENIIAGLKTLTTSRERQALPEESISPRRWHRNPAIISKNMTNICCPAVITFIFFVPFFAQYFYYTVNLVFHKKNLDFFIGIAL